MRLIGVGWTGVVLSLFVAAACESAAPPVTAKARRPVSITASPAEIVAGDPVTLAWLTEGEASVEIGDVPALHTVSEATEQLLDIRASPTARTLPRDHCNVGWRDEGCPIVRFPEGFTFPFDGESHSEARVYLNGVISFDVERTGPSHEIEALPTANQRYVHLAPFWTDLAEREHVFYDVGRDPKGRFLVVQWDHVLWTQGPSDLTFQAVLWEDGDFDFRYGDMTADDHAVGEAATIGYQNTTGTNGVLISYLSPAPALAHAGFSFRLSRELPPSGDAVVVPLATRDYRLVARWPDGASESATAAVTVHPRTILAAEIDADSVDEGGTISIRWRTTNANSVEIREGSERVHTALPSELDEGAFELVAAGVGTYAFTVIAHGALGTQASSTFEVHVLEPFGLDVFDGDAAIAPGGKATLRWRARGARRLSLTTNGATVDVTDRDPADGSISVSPSSTTRYRLEAEGPALRRDSKEWTVRVVRARLDDARAASARGAAGGTTEISWSASSPSGDEVGARIYAMRELRADEAPFEDVEGSGTVIEGDTAMVSLPEGFVFPFLGEEKRRLRVTATGFVSFDADADAAWTNRRLPSPRTPVQLAPFWDALERGERGTIVAGPISDARGDRFVVQWRHHQYWNGRALEGDLDFQIVLFPDGTFDFRYGAMSGPDATRVNGGAASIGFQDVFGRKGHSVSYQRRVQGGLAHRTFRFDGALPASGTVTVRLPASGEILVCAAAPGDEDCRTLIVTVDAPGDLALTELMLDPSGGARNQWFELRNLSGRPIALDGLRITSGAVAHLIAPPAALVVGPGRHVTFAAGPSPGFVPDYVYGDDIQLDPASGDLALESSGIALAGVEWDATWSVKPGVSLSLDGSLQTAANSAGSAPNRASFCDGVDAYDGTNRGSPGRPGRDCRSPYDVDFHSSMPFLDIASTGAEVVFTAPDVRIGRGMPFEFTFFGALQSDLVIRDLGEISFNLICPYFHCLSDPTLGGIAAFSSFDLAARHGSRLVQEESVVEDRRVWIAQWTDFTLSDRIGSLTFQVQIWEDGDVVLAYRKVDGDDDFRGEEAYIGIWGIDASPALAFWGEASLYPGRSIRYRYREP